MKKIFTGPGLIILAGIFWGSMGLFVRRFNAAGFSSMQITCMRLSIGALCFSLLLHRKEPEGFRIDRGDIPLFLGLGLLSVLFFTVCYFKAIEMMPLSVAAILLYTSPIWVMLMSVLFFKERLSLIKLISLGLAFGGCVLVSGLGEGGLSLWGLLIGIGSGIGYGLYSILGTVALRKYSPFAVTCYTFITAAVGAWFICAPGEMLRRIGALPDLPLWLLFILISSLITAVAPYLLYTLGLEKVEASKAAILATVEPMVATLIGIAVFGEALSLMSGLGIALILAAIVLLNMKKTG